MWTRGFVLFVGVVLCHTALVHALDVVSGKSGEEQVKEALDKAEKESERAAKEQLKGKQSSLDKAAAEIFSGKKSKTEEGIRLSSSARQTESLKQTLERKTAEERANFIKKLKDKVSTEKALAKIMQDRGSSLETSARGTNEKESAGLQEDSEKKMTEMARKLNSLVLRFQRKMDRLQHRQKTEAEVVSKDTDESLSNEKSLRGKTASTGGLDIAALTHGINSKLGGGSTSYKEDTKLEDRLAMEAEEEKKFSNGDTYDYGDEEANNDKSTSSVGTAASTLSPKEQATQEMQSYNALISTESNRELSQIQEEISKATQSSMGQVSVVGQKQEVNTESPQLPGLPGLPGLDAIGGGGGGSSSPAGGLEQLGATDGLESGAAAGSEISNQQSTTLPEQTVGGDTQAQTQVSSATEGQMTSQELAAAAQPQVAGAEQQGLESSQKPIEIGGDQNPVEMGTLGATGAMQQPQAAGPQIESVSSDQMAGGGLAGGLAGSEVPDSAQLLGGAAGAGAGGAAMLEAGGQTPQLMGGGQIQQMSFKKSKISSKVKRRTKINKKNSLSAKTKRGKIMRSSKS